MGISSSDTTVLPPRIVTSIVPNPRKPGRFAVQLDGADSATLSIEAIERLGLATGVVVDDRLARELEREAGILETYDRALNMLASRGRASAELRRLLIRKGEPADRVDAAIERLTAVGFLDDAAFARQFARSKGVGSGLSRRRLQQELSRRGVARETSAEAVDEVFVEEGVDEDAAIEQVARKKLRSLSSVDAPTRKRRLFSFLARRGYDSDAISRVLKVVLAGASDENVDDAASE
jgi:regulatory protein